ncbi:MAG: 7-cyano-7-deazaguanine synthase QueC [Euryarchaeota archaeon]|nr:7-cyano-7-deazaguanine synthase QueC [Euryarchaeota archaeon]
MRGVALLSSGLDSVAALGLAREQGTEIKLALTFDYGQRAARREVEYAMEACRIMGIEHKAINLDWLREITRTALVDTGKALPEPGADELDSMEKASKTARQVWVPNRNGVFVNIGASFAEALGCGCVVAGFDAEEAATFPDNTPEFVEAANGALGYSTLNKVKIVAPVVAMRKDEIAAEGLRLGMPLEWSWSCYLPGPRPCGRCESCRRRERAFATAGKEDPLLRRLGP